MASAYLALLLLFFPTIALADSLHLPLVRRSQTGTVDRNKEAQRLRVRYGYIKPQPVRFAQSHPNKRASAAGIPMSNQVYRHCYFPCFISTHHKNRMEMPATLLP